MINMFEGLVNFVDEMGVVQFILTIITIRFATNKWIQKRAINDRKTRIRMIPVRCL